LRGFVMKPVLRRIYNLNFERFIQEVERHSNGPRASHSA
jgi:hypothetical protein